jgi:hypothetical protein
MGNLFLIVFLLLFGFMGLVPTALPHWVIDVAAIVAAIALAVGRGWFKKAP